MVTAAAFPDQHELENTDVNSFDGVIRAIRCHSCGGLYHFPPTTQEISDHAGHMRELLGPIESVLVDITL